MTGSPAIRYALAAIAPDHTTTEYHMHITHRAPVPRRAFTAIELLVVLAIIAVLVGLVLAISTRVAGTGKQRLTEQTLRVLDTALGAYTQATGANPPPVVEDPRVDRTANQVRLLPVADARNMTGGTEGAIINSVGLFILQAQNVPEAKSALANLDPKLLRDFSPDGITNTTSLQPVVPTVFDGWGNPIRYVHPAFKGSVNAQTLGLGTASEAASVQAVLGPIRIQGATYGISQIRRTPASRDADGGTPPADRPYFYSAGPDGDPSTIDDNIYLTRPSFPSGG